MEQEDGTLAEPTRAWVQGIADRDYGGNFGRAAAALLEMLHAAEQSPNPWSYLEARVRGGRPSARPPDGR